MDPQTGAILALALAIMGNAVVWLFKTPKEVAGATDKRVNELEDKHNALNVSVAVLTKEVSHLARTIELLTLTIKAMDERRVSGRHPRQ
jgi:hypothetical protein